MTSPIGERKSRALRKLEAELADLVYREIAAGHDSERVAAFADDLIADCAHLLEIGDSEFLANFPGLEKLDMAEALSALKSELLSWMRLAPDQLLRNVALVVVEPQLFKLVYVYSKVVGQATFYKGDRKKVDWQIVDRRLAEMTKKTLARSHANPDAEDRAGSEFRIRYIFEIFRKMKEDSRAAETLRSRGGGRQ